MNVLLWLLLASVLDTLMVVAALALQRWQSRRFVMEVDELSRRPRWR